MSGALPYGMQVDPNSLERLITAYELAASRVQNISSDIARRGQVRTPWTADVVSVEMAAHYNRQIVDDPYSTYAAVTLYEAELRAAAKTMRQILGEYQKAELEAEGAINAAGRLTTGT